MRKALLSAAALTVAIASTASAETLVERGKYLVEGPAACGNCHTPMGPDGPVAGKSLAGGMPIVDDEQMTAIAANITPDPETGIGKWTDAQLKKAIREGIRPDGSLIGPPMPFEVYVGMDDDDLDAIVAYLRTVPAIENAVAKSTYRFPLPPAYTDPISSVQAPEPAATAEYGAYLGSAIAHCSACHTRLVEGRMDTANFMAGGFPFPGPWGTSVSANLTPHADGLAGWSDAEIGRAITQGVSRDGRALLPPMGYGYYAKMSERDLAAIVAWLRSLTPLPSPKA